MVFFIQHPAGFVFVRWVVDGAAAHDAAPALRLPVARGALLMAAEDPASNIGGGAGWWTGIRLDTSFTC